MSSQNQQASVRYFVIAALILVPLVSGCRSRRPFDRITREPMAMPAPPVVEVPPETSTEVPLHLDSSSAGSHYHAPRVSVAPQGSTGFSTDIRYPRPRLRPVPMPNGTVPTAGTAPPMAETPVNLPRNGQQPSEPATPPAQTPASETAPGIPRYTVLEPNVAAGGQPTLDGMNWLKERGFRTVINLLPESEADPAEAAMVRQLGLDYVTLPITADTLDSMALSEFNRLLDDASLRPIFVHDSNGSRTGAMWFLHRVMIDRVSEDSARRQAAKVGLGESDTELWLAIQRLLADKR